jgi:hypothetical protein
MIWHHDEAVHFISLLVKEEQCISYNFARALIAQQTGAMSRIHDLLQSTVGFQQEGLVLFQQGFQSLIFSPFTRDIQTVQPGIPLSLHLDQRFGRHGITQAKRKEICRSGLPPVGQIAPIVAHRCPWIERLKARRNEKARFQGIYREMDL